MYERFTDRARKVIQLANQEAVRFNHEYIGTEHILLGLVKEGSGVAANVLKNLDIDLSKVRVEVEKIVRSGEDVVICSKLPQTPKAKKVIEYSIEEAHKLDHNYVGTEHLLLGLLREEEGVAAQVLMSLGLKLEDVREEVLNLLGHNMTTPNPTSPAGNAKSKTAALDSFGYDLTVLARNGKLASVLGRADDLERMLLVLSCHTRSCPLLVGPSGVGKTALAEALAQLIVRGDAPEVVAGKRLVALDLAMMAAGAGRAEVTTRLKAILSEVRRAKDVILFLDDLHLWEGSPDMLAPLALALAGRATLCIGAMTAAPGQPLPRFADLSRRFVVLPVAPLGRAETLAALREHRRTLEEHHRVRITDEALEAAALVEGPQPQRAQPGRAISALDLAGAAVRLRAPVRPPEFRDLEAQIEQLNVQKEEAVANQEFDRAALLRDEADRLKQQKASAQEEWRLAALETCGVVDEKVVAEVVWRLGGAPGVVALPQDDGARLLEIEGELGKAIIGQDEAIHTVAGALRRRWAGLEENKGPLGSFIFAGLMGVGKTLLAKRLAAFMFGDENALVQIDMSEYMEKHNVSRLIGAPHGIIGYNEPGVLTESVRQRPRQIVVLEEIERAHPDAWSIVQQIMEEERLIDNIGREVDFRGALLIMMTSTGSEHIWHRRGGCFGRDRSELTYGELKARVQDELTKQFRLEFLARPEVVVFRMLTKAVLTKVLDLALAPLRRRLLEKGLTLVLTEAAHDFLIAKGTTIEFGARSLSSCIEQHLCAPLTEGLLRGAFVGPATLTVGAQRTGDEEALVFHIEAS